ncbi:TetR/AcrR family transcriptional regulator [Streptomyces tibetensis]|uniref:TetR/AcrR family transcriptional regulator n=1 Tax=Streptomyces tibetensis TaxID=2382123 RepID=UPI0038168E1F
MADLSQRGRLHGLESERTGGRKRDSNATRATLLCAARDLFARHGFDAVTVRDIGENAGADASLIAVFRQQGCLVPGGGG